MNNECVLYIITFVKKIKSHPPDMMFEFIFSPCMILSEKE